MNKIIMIRSWVIGLLLFINTPSILGFVGFENVAETKRSLMWMPFFLSWGADKKAHIYDFIDKLYEICNDIQHIQTSLMLAIDRLDKNPYIQHKDICMLEDIINATKITNMKTPGCLGIDSSYREVIKVLQDEYIMDNTLCNQISDLLLRLSNRKDRSSTSRIDIPDIVIITGPHYSGKSFCIHLLQSVMKLQKCDLDMFSSSDNLNSIVLKSMVDTGSTSLLLVGGVHHVDMIYNYIKMVEEFPDADHLDLDHKVNMSTNVLIVLELNYDEFHHIESDNRMMRVVSVIDTSINNIDTARTILYTFIIPSLIDAYKDRLVISRELCDLLCNKYYNQNFIDLNAIQHDLNMLVKNTVSFIMELQGSKEVKEIGIKEYNNMLNPQQS